MEFTQVLLKPLITEKTTFVKEGANQVAFLVQRRAGLPQRACRFGRVQTAAVVDCAQRPVGRSLQQKRGPVGFDADFLDFVSECPVGVLSVEERGCQGAGGQ